MDGVLRAIRRTIRGCNRSTRQLEYSSPAELAGLILGQDVWTSIDRKDVHQALPDTGNAHRGTRPSESWDPEERWRELLEWRHPRIDLNLLQLAVIFDRKECVAYLWKPIFTREENYRDENARLVNHPLHLACRLGHSSALEEMGVLADEILCKEGTVDLSQARIQRSTSGETSMEPNNVRSREPEKSLDSAGSLEASNDNELLALMTRHSSRVGRIPYAMTPVVGTPMSLIEKEDNGCVLVLFHQSLKRLHESLLSHTLRPSAVENLWSIVDTLSRRGQTADEFRVCMKKLHALFAMSYLIWDPLLETEVEASAFMDSNGVHKNEVFFREMSILACQLLACVAEDTESLAASLEVLWSNFVVMLRFGKIEFMQKAASYLPKKHLPSLIIFLKWYYRIEYQGDPNSIRSQSLFSGLQRIEALAGETSLQHLCMLKILKSVRGDARAARNLSALPEPLRKRFHVPLQDLYDRLSAESA